MKIKILKMKDFYAGLLFIFFGLVAVLVSFLNYPIGTAVHMGPGIFPIGLGCMLILLGIIIMAPTLKLSGETISLFSLRPLLFILGAILGFTLLVESVGLLLALLALIFLSAAGGWEFRIREVAVMYLALAALAVGVFVYGLGLPFKLWPS